MYTLKFFLNRLVVVFALLLSRVPAHADTKTVELGQPLTISVSATGDAPFTYQWRKDGVNIAGATAGSYSIAAASLASAGVYTATVSNTYGSTISDDAVVAVNSATVVAPTITTQPVALTVMQSSAATFTVAANGTSLTYQWSKNGVAISGATSGSYTIASATLSDATNYSVMVSNSAGSVLSANALLTVSTSVTPPTITTQPVALTVSQGSAATFSVVASGTSLSYQWLKYGMPITGATSASYTIAAATLGDAANYSVSVSNSAGSVTSWNVALMVNAVTVVAPTITAQPTALTVTQGSAATFSVVASGTSPSYQWLKYGVAIAGATSASYTIAAATLGDAANYSVYVSNSAGSVTSSTVALTVDTRVIAPTITTQPVALTVSQGSSATFSVVASGTSPSYQWLKYGMPITGATSASYTITAATLGDAANYSVSVSNSAGSVTSWNVALMVNTVTVVAPTITTQPAALAVTQGSAASFTVAASGTSLNYQWYKNSVAISGATTVTYTIASTVLSSAGTYSVVVSNTAGSVTSSGATLTVNTPVIAPTITTQPTSQTVTQGNSAMFSVVASGTSLTYQWYKGSTALTNGTSSSFAIAATTSSDAGSYSVRISNSAGTVTSSVVNLTVNAPLVIAPTITTQPTSLTVTEGGAATFTVGASGTSVSFQWYKSTTAVAGATGSSFTIGATTPSDAGSYSVKVSNSAGSVTSSVVSLTVNPSLNFAELTPTSYTARGQNSAAEAVGMLFDGKTTTKWVDNSAFTWVQVTFAAPTVLDAYSLASASDAPDRDPISWTLSGSNDGVTWNVIDTRSAQTWATRQLTRDFVLSARSAAYTQFRFNFNATSGSITQLAEVEMYGAAVISAKITPSTYSARGQASTSYAVSKLFDGKTSTRWADYNAASWVKVGTNLPTTLRRYTLTSGSDAAISDPIAWTLYGSNDGINWTVIETRSGQSWSSRKLKRDFTLTTASSKYVWFRFNFQIAAGWNTTQLAEMELFGEQ